MSLPDPPSGYSAPIPYGEQSIRTQILGIAIGTGIGISLLPVILGPVEQEIRTLTLTGGSFSAFTAVFLVALAGIGNIVFHEIVHFTVGHSLGYDPEIEWTYLNPKVFSEGQLVKRNHSIIILFTPFILLSSAYILTLSIAHGSAIRLVIWSALLTNAVGSSGDILGVLRLLQEPRGTLICTMWHAKRESYLYRPK